MKDFSKLLEGVICKKNNGYKYHRYFVPEDNRQFFTKSMDITPSDIEIATNMLPILNINNREDMFLGLTCVAMLSAYEKRQKLIAKHNGKELKACAHEDNLYMYKDYVNKIITEGLKKDIDFNFCIKPDDKGIEVTYITLGGVQFSFHNGNSGNVARFAQEHNFKQYKDQDWNKGITFQNAAKDVWLYALHLKNTSKLRYIDEKPLDYAKSISEGLYKREDNDRKI